MAKRNGHSGRSRGKVTLAEFPDDAPIDGESSAACLFVQKYDAIVTHREPGNHVRGMSGNWLRCGRRFVALWLVGLAAALSGHPALSQDGGTHMVPMFPAAGDEDRQGFVRVINHSRRGGEVWIQLFDDDGVRFGPVTLVIDADETVHFNSKDLAEGNATKGLSGGIRSASGDWRLILSSSLDIEVLSYIRTPADGFLTSMHDVVLPVENRRHRVAIFNPGSNRDQESLLRLMNTGDQDAEVTITGTDDTGASPGGEVSLTLPAGASRTIDARGLESGVAGLDGALGDGTGKWRLTIDADPTIRLMSLLQSPTGHLTNLSTAPAGVDGGVHAVPMFPSAWDPLGNQGFVRIVNHSAESGEVTIHGFDDTDRDFGTSRLVLDANGAVHFNSDDLELGNPAKGLTGGTGTGEGDWRLELTSELDIEVLAYIRNTTDGFLTAMHDTVPREGGRYRVATFNPGANVNQVSRLRLVNAADEAAEVRITGIDGAGRTSSGSATVTVPGGASRTLSARELEGGGEGFDGELGDGADKWQFVVESDRSVSVMSLLASPTGHLTNLSTAPSLDFAPADRTVFDDRVVGGRIASADPEYYVDFPTAGRFRETKGTDVYEGNYTYTRTDANRGTLVSNYDDGERCTGELTFRSRTAGKWTLTCEDGDSDETGWWIVDAPTGGLRTEYEVDDTITTVPTGTWSPDVVSGGATVSVQGRIVVIEFEDGAFVEQGDHRYLCESAGGCRIDDRVVQSGRIVATTTFDMAADLVVESPTTSDTVPLPGGAVTLGTTVRNRGSDSAPATSLRFYRSSNLTVSTGDVELGSVAVPALAPWGASEHSIDFSAPEEPGTYYFGACVADIEGEANTRNDCSGGVAVNVAGVGSEVVVPDATLRAVVLHFLGKAPGDPITVGDMLTLTSLNMLAYRRATGTTNTIESGLISNLEGLQFAKGLQVLFIGENVVSDLSPLSGLTRLVSLDLGANNDGIRDLSPISRLSNLEQFRCSRCAITDLAPLANLKQLFYLSLSYNRIADLTPLSGLGNLRDIHMNFNEVHDVKPLAGLRNLRVIHMHWNEIEDVKPLAALTDIRSLRLESNRIKDISSLADLKELRVLSLYNNSISDVSAVSELTALFILGLSRNDITDISPLAGLTNMERLWLGNNVISDITALSEMRVLRELHVESNDIDDVSPLAGLTNLKTLWLENNGVADIGPLADLAEVSELRLGRNRIVEISPLHGSRQLETLELRHNRIVEIATLEWLTELDEVDLSYNEIVDLAPLSANEGLGDGDRVDLRGNPLSDESLENDVPALTGRGAQVETSMPWRHDFIHDDTVVILPVDEDIATETVNTGLPLDDYASDFYSYFHDEFDFLMFFSNLDDISDHDNAGYHGIYQSVSNDVEGTGRRKFYNSRYGSRERLKGVMHFPYNRALLNGPSLHEILHAWANHALPTAVGAHWGFSSANGQLGGFDLANLVEIGEGRYTAGRFGTFGNGGNGPAYSPVELYFAGYLPLEEVSDLWVAEDGQWVTEEDGSLARNDNGDPIFRAQNVRTHTIDDVVAKNGHRIPSMTEAQWDFRAALVLLTDDDHPATQEQLDRLSEHAAWFSLRGSDDHYGWLHNFHQATRSRGSIMLDGLAEARKSRASRPTDLPASYGSVPRPHASLIDGTCARVARLSRPAYETAAARRQAIQAGAFAATQSEQ